LTAARRARRERVSSPSNARSSLLPLERGKSVRRGTPRRFPGPTSGPPPARTPRPPTVRQQRTPARPIAETTRLGPHPGVGSRVFRGGVTVPAGRPCSATSGARAGQDARPRQLSRAADSDRGSGRVTPSLGSPPATASIASSGPAKGAASSSAAGGRGTPRGVGRRAGGRGGSPGPGLGRPPSLDRPTTGRPRGKTRPVHGQEGPELGSGPSSHGNSDRSHRRWPIWQPIDALLAWSTPASLTVLRTERQTPEPELRAACRCNRGPHDAKILFVMTASTGR